MALLRSALPTVTLITALSLTICATEAHAAPREHSMVVTHNVNLRRDPSTNHSPIRLLHVGDTLELLAARPVRGFYHVLADQDTGWVWTKNVHLRTSRNVALAPMAIARAAAPSHECADPHYRWTAKTGVIEGSAEEATIRDILSNWDPPEIANTAADWCVARDSSESRVIVVVGYVRRVKKESDGDWHIELTNGPREVVQNHCVVVEIPPAEINPAYARARRDLTTLLGRHTLPTTYDPAPSVQVRVTGLAFFDGEHRGAAAHPMTAHQHGRCNSSARALWEIHPVTAISMP